MKLLLQIAFFIGTLISTPLLLAQQDQLSPSTQSNTQPDTHWQDNPLLDNALRKIEEEQIYLKQLSNIQNAVEKELAIVRLIRECGGLDAVCTGKGLSVKPKTTDEEEIKPSPKQAPVRPLVENIPQVSVLRAKPPELLHISGNVAVMQHNNRIVSVHEGDYVGKFRVSKVTLDYVELKGQAGDLRLFLHWQNTNEEYAGSNVYE